MDRDTFIDRVRACLETPEGQDHLWGLYACLSLQAENEYLKSSLATPLDEQQYNPHAGRVRTYRMVCDFDAQGQSPVSERMPFDAFQAAGECAERFHQAKVAELVELHAGSAVRFVSTDPIEAARTSYVDVSDDDVRRALAGTTPDPFPDWLQGEAF